MPDEHNPDEPNPDEPNLRPATADEIAQSLAFALRYAGRKRVYDADEVMARHTADRLVHHLQQSGFVLMKEAPRPAPTTAGMPPSVPTPPVVIR